MMTISIESALDHVQHALDNGGSTRRAVVGFPLKDIVLGGGYGTGIAGTELRLPVSMGASVISHLYREWLRCMMQQWSNPPAWLHVGSWVDCGFVYFDLSRSFERLEDAIEFAQGNKQLAVWDDVESCVAWDARWADQVDNDVCYRDSDGNKVC